MSSKSFLHRGNRASGVCERVEGLGFRGGRSLGGGPRRVRTSAVLNPKIKPQSVRTSNLWPNTGDLIRIGLCALFHLFAIRNPSRHNYQLFNFLYQTRKCKPWNSLSGSEPTPKPENPETLNTQTLNPLTPKTPKPRNPGSWSTLNDRSPLNPTLNTPNV